MISTLKKLQAKKAAQENSGGFTLIELLIVIVVLGILAAVVVFSLGGVTGSSSVAACKADGATVSTAIAAEQAQNPGVPAVLGTGAASAGDLATTYLQSIPNNVTHYKFSVAAGVLYVGASTSTPGAETTLWTAGTPTGWIPWAGAASCDTTGMVK